MGRKYDFKYIVIGSGPAGAAAATTLAKAKKRVALIEGGAFGGSNLNTRDIPYNVTLDFAHTYYKALHLPEFNFQDFSFSFPSIIAHQMKAIIESGGSCSAKALESTGLICIRGYANFLDDHTIAVGERKFSSEYFILATGASLDTAGIDGLDAVNYLPPETALKIRRLPQAVIVVGGGSTGCEIAEYYATLGVKTLIAEKSPRLLPLEDPEASQAITDHFIDDLGIMVLTDSQVTSLNQDPISKYVIFKSDHTEKMVRVDCVVLATGSKPHLDYGLSNTSIKLQKNGALKLDKFQTSLKHIYAIGDCANPASSTERAEYEGRLLANNLIGKNKSLANYNGFVRFTGTLPAVASFGPSEADLKRQKRRYKKSIVYLKDIPAGKIYGIRLGFVKLISDHAGRIIGGTLVAEDAKPMSSEIALAIRHRITALEIASTPHPVNEFSYATQLAAQKLVSAKLVSPKLAPKKPVSTKK